MADPVDTLWVSCPLNLFDGFLLSAGKYSIRHAQLIMNKKEYVLIDENNIIVEMIKIYDKEKIKKLSIYKEIYRIEEKKIICLKGLI
ncbi:hypothetical protein [Brachyspira hyodysenteriae]|uniref:hypothetical protein n=1 Tax=Brachyspira hyodysenteriae TaxID=159 RepID=UPI0022CE014A|nr:hypothetical protein [Brachyspira hyodysenteriae]MDA0023872.1 hypothetical protein [Brachyspira hyodysenteriae]